MDSNWTTTGQLADSDVISPAARDSLPKSSLQIVNCGNISLVQNAGVHQFSALWALQVATSMWEAGRHVALAFIIN